MSSSKQNSYPINRKSKRFAMGVKIYIFVLTVLILGILVFLWVSLDNYQKKIDKPKEAEQPQSGITINTVSKEETEEAAQECFMNYVENMTVSDLMTAWYDKHPEHLDAAENVEKFLTEQILNASYECYKETDYSVDNPVYTIMCEGNRLADFTLTGSGKNWSIGNVDLLVSGTQSYSATIPEGATLYINGAAVAEDNIADESGYVKVEDYDEKLTNPVKLCKYEINELIQAPSDEEVSVTVPDGRQAVPAVDGIYYETLQDENADSYKKKSEEFIRSLLNYYTKGKENAEGNMGAVLSHVASGSAAARVINGSLSGVIWMTADYTASYDLSVSEVYILAENCCCVDVSYIQTGESKLYNTGDGTYRVYLLNDGNGYKIVQFAGIQ